MNIHRCARTCAAGRALLVDRVMQQGWSVEAAAAAAGISKRTVYKWVKRFTDEGADGLLDRSSRPHRSPTRLQLEKADIVLELRRTRRMTAAKIAAVLHLARSTVARLLSRNQLGRLGLIDPSPEPRRYEWPKPGDMVHIDTKKLGRIGCPGHRMHGDRTRRSRGLGWEYVHVAIDDHTRLAYVEVLRRENLAASVAFLQRACVWYARHGIVVQRVLTDNGTAYKDQYTAACARLGTWHLRTRPYTPRTNGKAERLIQTLLREWAYARSYPKSRRRTAALLPYLRYYNRKRPHAGCGALTPMKKLERAA
ncbi:MAG: IS481 family transposase [Deltaproteobacteria bacterium]|nr:MAG: IS481 family transposase [Deltaproteobacteria bacterium]